MTVAIFVSRDCDQEFPRYKKWFETKDVPDPEVDECSVTLNPDGASVALGGVEQKLRTLSRWIAGESLLVIVVQRNRTANGSSPDGQRDVFDGCVTGKFLDDGVHNVCTVFYRLIEDVLEQRKLSRPSGIELYAFIHWGGGSPIEYESLFAKQYEKLTPINQDSNRLIKRFSAFACSSRRRECFDVTSPVIALPKTQEDLRRIVSRFTFDRVKDVMTDYVCQASSSSHPECYKLNPHEADALRRYLNWMFDGELKRRFRQEDASWMMDVRKNNVICQITGDKMCTEVCFDNAVSALFAQLLREGVYHV